MSKVFTTFIPQLFTRDKNNKTDGCANIRKACAQLMSPVKDKECRNVFSKLQYGHFHCIHMNTLLYLGYDALHFTVGIISSLNQK